MDGGRMIAIAPPSELIGRAKSPTRVIVRTAPPLASTLVDSLPDVLRSCLRRLRLDSGHTGSESSPRGIGPARG